MTLVKDPFSELSWIIEALVKWYISFLKNKFYCLKLSHMNKIYLGHIQLYNSPYSSHELPSNTSFHLHVLFQFIFVFPYFSVEWVQPVLLVSTWVWGSSSDRWMITYQELCLQRKMTLFLSHQLLTAPQLGVEPGGFSRSMLEILKHLNLAWVGLV